MQISTENEWAPMLITVNKEYLSAQGILFRILAITINFLCALFRANESHLCQRLIKSFRLNASGEIGNSSHL